MAHILGNIFTITTTSACLFASFLFPVSKESNFNAQSSFHCHRTTSNSLIMRSNSVMWPEVHSTDHIPTLYATPVVLYSRDLAFFNLPPNILSSRSLEELYVLLKNLTSRFLQSLHNHFSFMIYFKVRWHFSSIKMPGTIYDLWDMGEPIANRDR